MASCVVEKLRAATLEINTQDGWPYQKTYPGGQADAPKYPRQGLLDGYDMVGKGHCFIVVVVVIVIAIVFFFLSPFLLLVSLLDDELQWYLSAGKGEKRGTAEGEMDGWVGVSAVVFIVVPPLRYGRL